MTEQIDISEVKEKIAELNKKLDDREADLINAKQEVARELYEEVICPMCYRLNPQHATMDNGIGCKSCQEKEDWCGESRYLGKSKCRR